EHGAERARIAAQRPRRFRLHGGRPVTGARPGHLGCCGRPAADGRAPCRDRRHSRGVAGAGHDVTVIPQAPGPDFVFTPPPSWGAPPGFDPRKGHVVDPAWPPPPDGWQFWTLPVVSPATRLGNGLNKIGKLRIVFGVLAALFLVSRLTGVFGGGPSTGVGSCWEESN